LASRSQKDVYEIIKISQTDSREGIDFESNYSMEEVNEMVGTMKKLLRVRDVVLDVNREYIRSAAQDDDYRTEPIFKLQGSYRNMNRMAEKVLAIMNDEELETLILSNYENDSQTLTSDAEANMLKLRVMCGWATAQDDQRWADICKAFSQNVKMRGVGADDQAGQIILQLQGFSDGLDGIRQTIGQSVAGLVEKSSSPTVVQAGDSNNDQTNDALLTLAEELRNYTTGAITVDPSVGVQRVAVMHKVPKSILSVLENQFQLMNEWMKPIMENQQGNAESMERLRQTVEQCMSSYDGLLNDLNSDRADINADDDGE
jgi:hypothetical protein